MASEDTQFGGPRDPGVATRMKSNDGRRYTGGRPSFIDDNDQCILVAEAFASGMTHTKMSEKFNVERHTIARWRRDPRVKAHVSKMIEDRILTITRKTDSEIERRLGNVSEMSVKEILDIRKEYLGGAFRNDVEGIDDETTAQAMKLLEKNPQLAAQMIALLTADPQEETPADDIPVTT